MFAFPLYSHMGDYESWMELCDLYLQEHDYNKASFCMEELILSNPHNHLFHQRYAEVRQCSHALLRLLQCLIGHGSISGAFF